MTHALQVLHTLQWHHPGGRALLQLAQAPTQDYHSYTHALLGGVEDKVVGPNDPPVKKTREHSAAKQLWPNRDVTTRYPAGLGGEGRTGGVHSADVDGVELPSPLLAEAQSIDCVISAVYFSTAQGTAPVHPDPPTCTTEANGLGSRRRNQDTLHVLYAS